MECNQPAICEERFKNVNQEIKQIKERVAFCEQTKDILIELKVLSKEQAKANEQRDIMLKDQSGLLAKTVQSLEYVITNQKEHENEILKLNDKVNTVDDKGKIDTATLIRGGIMFLLGAFGTYAMQFLESIPK